MITAVDTNVLLDVFSDDAEFGRRSAEALRRCIAEGRLLACDVVWAETGAWFPDAKAAESALSALRVDYSWPQSCEAGVKLTRTKAKGGSLLVTVKTSTGGTVELSGPRLWSVKRSMNPGSHQVAMSLTKAGIAMLHHHQRARLRATLTVGKQTVAKTASVRL